MAKERLTQADMLRQDKYVAAKAKQLGNLHERMKYVIALMHDAEETTGVPGNLWHAIYDLETEVRYCTPAQPPYARRAVRVDMVAVGAGSVNIILTSDDADQS